MKKVRSWFFNSPPTTAGERFSKKNIPTQGTYINLLDSVTFKLEKKDEATVSSRGLAYAYSNIQAIELRNKPIVDRRVLDTSQMTSVGVIINGIYTESIHSETPDYSGNSVSGGGIKSIAKVYTLGDIKRISYANELDISTFEDIPVVDLNSDKLKVVCVDTDTNLHYLVSLKRIIETQGSTNNFSFEWEQTTASDTWDITHDLGYEPAVSLLIDGDVNISDAAVEHLSDKRLRIKLSEPKTGKAYLT